jgi:dissimilatory sulfite reductase (desulfoviridin) alpha/beta subunit
MMRLRIPNGIVTATQLRTLGEISEQFGKGFADITTRQQMQLAVDAVAPHLRQAEKRRRAESYIDLVKLGAAMKKLPPRSRKIPCATARA